MQIWTYDQQNNKLRPENVKLGNLQRQFKSLVVDRQDRFAYVGSTSGDVMQACGWAAGRLGGGWFFAAGLLQLALCSWH